MPQTIALLRGINVGGHRVKMDRLRLLFEELDLRHVSTFIASGNVIFSNRRWATRSRHSCGPRLNWPRSPHGIR
jgi:uncharacterized protein (DUF1697 family)